MSDNSYLRHPYVSPLFAVENPEKPICPILIQIGESERMRDENISFVIEKFKNSTIKLEIYESMVLIYFQNLEFMI